MPRARSAVLLEPMTALQRSRYHSVAIAIQEVLESGGSIACVKDPEVFDELRTGRRNSLCLRCPVLERCRRYVESGVDVTPGGAV